MKKFFRKLWRGWFPQHILYVTHRSKERKIHVKSFKKISPKKITGTNIHNESFELHSVEPMDYFIEEYRDDLE
jgi:hypothetical protein